MTLGEKIQALRREAGLSQEGLADQLGVSRQAVSKWETNLSCPDSENLMALAELFHRPLDTFFLVEARHCRKAAHRRPQRYRPGKSAAFSSPLGSPRRP